MPHGKAPPPANARTAAPQCAAVRPIAFYLPQFHPIPENDAWWGKGFTEWTNVTRAKPAFEGHHQPQLPADLGFYDLRVPEVMQQQADMARAAGIHGFCYYYYWFAGRRLLEKPLDHMLESGSPDFPFCLCWANENWSRRWDGSEQEILMKQEYGEDFSRRIFHDLLPFLRDARYITVDGKPVLLVYRVDIIPDCAEMTRIWREEAERAGLPGLYLVRVESFVDLDPRPYGFDAACEFPPHLLNSVAQADRANIAGLDPDFAGALFDYDKVARLYGDKPAAAFKRFKGIVPAWDNTARKKNKATVVTRSSPALYKAWLMQCLDETLQRFRGDERLLFINAWNEWAEGCHLEPDQAWGHQYLDATRAAIAAVREPQARAAPAGALDFAVALFENQQYEEAYAAFAALHEKEPRNPLLLVYLGQIAVRAGLDDDARNFFEHAASVSQDPANTYAAAGQRCLEGGFLQAAEHCFNAALQARPGFAGAAALLADTWMQQGRHADALSMLEVIAQRAPDQAVLARLVQVARDLGDPERELNACLRAAQFPDSLARAITLLPASAAGRPADALEAVRAFVALTRAPIAARPAATPRTRLRIAFILGHQVEAGVAARLEPLLRHLDPQRFETLILSRSTRGTQAEQRLHLLADQWVRLVDLDAAACVSEVRAQQPDILIDLHGFHDLSTLELVAQRHTPVQLGWHWPPQPMPLPTLDAVLVDACSARDDVLCSALGQPALTLAAPLAFQFPPLRPTLPRSSGPLRVGCMTPLGQLASHSLAALASAQQAVAGAALVLNATGANEHARTHALGVLQSAGADPARIEWIQASDAQTLCRAWQSVELGLVPPAGDSTYLSLLAAWSGVPVLAPVQQSDGTCLPTLWLRQLGAPDLICSADEWTATVTRLAADRSALHARGLALRATLEAHASAHEQAFAQAFATALEQAWQQASEATGATAGEAA